LWLPAGNRVSCSPPTRLTQVRAACGVRGCAPVLTLPEERVARLGLRLMAELYTDSPGRAARMEEIASAKGVPVAWANEALHRRFLSKARDALCGGVLLA
jgi:hypothetical protein